MSSSPSSSDIVTVQEFPHVVVISIVEGTVVRSADVARVCERIEATIEQTQGKTLCLDFAEVTHMSSTFLGHMVSLNKKLQGSGRRLVVAEVAPQIRDVLTISQVHKQIPIYNTVRDVVVGRPRSWCTLMAAAVACSALGLACLGAIGAWGLPHTGRTLVDGFATVLMVLIIAALPAPLVAWKLRRKFAHLASSQQWLAAAAAWAALVGAAALLWAAVG